MSENKILSTPLKESMKDVLKKIRRGMGLISQDENYYLIAATGAKLVNARDVKGLIKRGIAEFDNELAGVKWYKLTELGKNIIL